MLATQDEILFELGQRLRQQRLAQGLRQADLAAMANVSVGTIKAVEARGASSMESWIRVVCALGLQADLRALFELKRQSIAQMTIASEVAVRARQRVRKRSSR